MVKRYGYLVDHLTRYSASCVIRSKTKEVIVEDIFKIWISVFGNAQTFLVDNGGEFHNEDFRSLCENLNINIKTTAVESPWSNGLVEQHNAVLGNTVSRMMESRKYSLQLAFAWAIAAKNALKNEHGFSPNQLVFGKNPNFPVVEENRPPAMEGRSSSKIVMDNINALHSARQAFIKSESCEKLRRALRHNVRPSTGIRYITGDQVYDKRRSDNTWKGPAAVIGQESQRVLVKHGSTYVRMHPCILRLKKEADNFNIDVQLNQEDQVEDNSNTTNLFKIFAMVKM